VEWRASAGGASTASIEPVKAGMVAFMGSALGLSPKVENESRPPPFPLGELRNHRLPGTLILPPCSFEDWIRKISVLGTILIVVLLLLLLGAWPSWPHSRGWGYYPSGTLGLVLVIVLVLALLGRV